MVLNCPKQEYCVFLIESGIESNSGKELSLMFPIIPQDGKERAALLVDGDGSAESASSGPLLRPRCHRCLHSHFRYLLASPFLFLCHRFFYFSSLHSLYDTLHYYCCWTVHMSFNNKMYYYFSMLWNTHKLYLESNRENESKDKETVTCHKKCKATGLAA